MVTLLQISFVRVVVEAKPQREIRSGEIGGPRRKRIRSGDSGPGGTIESDIAGAGGQPHVRDFAVFCNGKLDLQLALLHLGRFRNRAIPILPDLLQNALQVRAEVDALRIAENFKIALLPPVCPRAQAEIAFLASASAVGCGRLRSLLNRGARPHSSPILTERLVWAVGGLQLPRPLAPALPS